MQHGVLRSRAPVVGLRTISFPVLQLAEPVFRKRQKYDCRSSKRGADFALLRSRSQRYGGTYAVRFMEAAAAASLLALGLAGCSDGGAKTKVAQAQQVVLEGVSVTASGCVRPVEKTDCL